MILTGDEAKDRVMWVKSESRRRSLLLDSKRVFFNGGRGSMASAGTNIRAVMLEGQAANGVFFIAQLPLYSVHILMNLVDCSSFFLCEIRSFVSGGYNDYFSGYDILYIELPIISMSLM